VWPSHKLALGFTYWVSNLALVKGLYGITEIHRMYVYTMGCPHEQTPPASLTWLSTQFKAPYTSSECKILYVMSKPLTTTGNSVFWGVLWGPLRILHPLRRGKVVYIFVCVCACVRACVRACVCVCVYSKSILVLFSTYRDDGASTFMGNCWMYANVKCERTCLTATLDVCKCELTCLTATLQYGLNTQD